MLGQLFNTIFYQPIFNLLVFLYNYVPGHNIVLVIILLAVLIKVITWPLNNKVLKSQKAMVNLQPKLDALKKQYKDDKEGLTKAMMALYKEEKVNPFGSCLPMLIQLPIFIAVYNVFRDELAKKSLAPMLYPFIANPGIMNTVVFGGFDFAVANPFLALITAGAQFLQTKMMPMNPPMVQGDGSKDESMAIMMNKQMMYIGPVLTFVVCYTLPSGLAFYWLIVTILTIVQQQLVFKKNIFDFSKLGVVKTGVIEGEVVKK